MLLRRMRPLAALLLVCALSTPSTATHCVTVLHDDFEGPLTWVASNTGLNQWRVVDEADGMQPFGYNAYTSSHYWYVGAPRVNGVTYLGGDSGPPATPSRLTSPPFLVPSAATDLEVHVAGGSEAGFDFLNVYVDDGTLTAVAGITGTRSYGPPLSVSLAPFAGSMVSVVFEFRTDFIVENGPGWNVDDVTVRSC